MKEIEIKSPFVESPTDCNYISYDNYKIKVVDADIKYSDFFDNYMLKNLPCLVKNVTPKWNCTEKWIKNDSVNCEYFVTNYGDLEAPVADCESITFNAHCKSDMKVKDYMHYFQNSPREKLLYLKDWHLQKLRPNDQFYEIPEIFASDWLNEFATDLHEDDFMFVYIGPQNSWTPLHADVYNSYSWSVNVVGRKKWTFFPPGEEENIKDSLGNLPLMFRSDNYLNKNIKYFEIIQERGDALFVPSGWHHQVVNLLDTISINHNWVNGCNIELVWLSLQKCLLSVEKEIIDLKDTPEFISQCQLILKSLFGMSFADFTDFISFIANKRLSQLQGKTKTGFKNFELGQNHVIFDLKTIYKIINLIETHPLSVKILSKDKETEVSNIKTTVQNILVKL